VTLNYLVLDLISLQTEHVSIHHNVAAQSNGAPAFVQRRQQIKASGSARVSESFTPVAIRPSAVVIVNIARSD
jgi:hypothetical protein